MDITVFSCGEQRCQPRYSYGPAVRKGYLFHYIVSGAGVFYADGCAHALHAGQLFMICPGQVTTYMADAQQPWHYIWLGFSGVDAEALIASAGLTRAAPILTATDGAAIAACMRQTYQDISQLPAGAPAAYAAAGGVLRFMALICAPDAQLTDAAMGYYEKAMWYIRAQLQGGVTVEQVAAFVGLSRSQLFRAFKTASGVSPSAAIAHARAAMAKGMLKQSDLSVTQIAQSCGYASAAHFCTAFRRDSGLSPSAYRRKKQPRP